MPRIKSLIIGVKIDVALKAHNCQASESHRIDKGDTRLKVRNRRGWDHYCKECAQKILSKDASHLIQLQNDIAKIRNHE